MYYRNRLPLQWWLMGGHTSSLRVPVKEFDKRSMSTRLSSDIPTLAQFALPCFSFLTIVSPQGSPRVTMVTFSCNQSRSICSLGAKYSEIEPKADFYSKVKIPWFQTWYLWWKCFYEIVSTLMVILKISLHLQCNRFKMIKQNIECQMTFIQQITARKNQNRPR